GIVEDAAIVVANVGEAVDEEDDVGVPLGMALVHHQPLPTGRRPPVDRADAVAGDEVANVRVFDAVALRSRDLAAGERLRLDRRQQSAERERLRVRLQTMGGWNAALPGDEAPRVSRPDPNRSEVVHAPAKAANGEVEFALLACLQP